MKNKMHNAKISVIIPTWNSSETLESTIKSCLNQTLKPLEILVCDDGSTDDSKNIVTKINDPIIVWIDGIHSGTPAIPRNKGMGLSKGDWIAFCDSDDEWFPTKLEKQISEITKTKKQAVCTNAFKKVNNITTNQKVINTNKINISFIDLLNSNDIVCSSAIIHKTIFNTIGGFTEITEHGSYADYLYWLRVTTKTNFVFVDEPLVIYNDHPETSMRKEKISDNEIRNNAFKNFKEWSKKTEKNKVKILIFKISMLKQKIKMFIIEKIWKQK